MYYLLTQTFQEQEKKLVELIRKIDSVDSIYMLGSTLLQKRTETVFMTDAPSGRNVEHYYLLVLVSKNSKYAETDLQDRIENTCRSFIAVTALVLDIEKFTTWYLNGHLFAKTINKIAVILYKSNNCSLPFHKSSESEGNTIRDNETVETQNSMVTEFIAGAELFLLRKQNTMAMFMLHQAVEQSLRLLFKKGTGLHINTHNIDKLLRYCSMVSYKIPDIFPRNNERNERLFSLLQKAYIHARYKNDFRVKAADVLIIIERVKTIQQLLVPNH